MHNARGVSNYELNEASATGPDAHEYLFIVVVLPNHPLSPNVVIEDKFKNLVVWIPPPSNHCAIAVIRERAKTQPAQLVPVLLIHARQLIRRVIREHELHAEPFPLFVVEPVRAGGVLPGGNADLLKFGLAWFFQLEH